MLFRSADLTRAVGYRFALLPLFAPYQADLVRQVVGPAMDPVGSQLANSQAAAQLAAALDAAEREAVRHHAQGQSVTALAVALACSRRQATAVSERMKEKVRLATLGDDKPEETLRELLLLLTPSYGALEANSSSTESDMLTLEPVTSPAGGIDE